MSKMSKQSNQFRQQQHQAEDFQQTELQQRQHQQQVPAPATTLAVASSSAGTSVTTTSTTTKTTPAVEALKMTLLTRSKAGAQFVAVESNIEHSLDANNRKFLIPPIGGNFGDCESTISPCGNFAAFADDQRVYVHNVEDGRRLYMLDAPRCINLMWSPRSTFLVCFAHHDAVRSADNNLSVFKISFASSSSSSSSSLPTAGNQKIDPVLRCGQAFWPALSWTADELFCVRRSKTSVICVKGDLSDLTPIQSLNLQLPSAAGKESSLAIAGGSTASGMASSSHHAHCGGWSTATIPQPFLAVFVPQIKQQVAAVHVYRLPDLTNAVMSRPFGRGDRATIQFSPSGSALTVVVRCDDDKTGSSYYGATQCFVVDIGTRSSEQIVLATGEGIHDCQWSPVADEFVVVHGIMPRNKATLYNSKGQKLFCFGEEPRNVCYWSPNGQAIALGGNGGMPGDYNFYSREAIAKAANSGVSTAVAASVASSGVKLGSISEKASHQFWLPDSRHFATCTVFTTLRVGNNYKIWKYTGEKVAEEKFPEALFAVHCIVPAKKRDSMLRGTAAQPGPWMRRYDSPVKDQSKVQQKAEAWKPRNASAAAAALLASSAPQGSAGEKPVSTTNGGSSSVVGGVGAGPVGAQVVVTKKKGGRR